MAKEPKAEKEKEAGQTIVWPHITLVTIYFVALGLALLVGLITLWPDTNAPAPSTEVQMILIVTMTGAMGSLVHGFRSLFWYVGNRAYTKSWTLMYLLLPFVGASLSLVFYFVLRGGLFSPEASVQATSPFGFAGISGLVGMFSNKATLKLQEVADSIFSTKDPTRYGEKGADNVDPKDE